MYEDLQYSSDNYLITFDCEYIISIICVLDPFAYAQLCPAVVLYSS
jgi:hypothetical protein